MEVQLPLDNHPAFKKLFLSIRVEHILLSQHEIFFLSLDQTPAQALESLGRHNILSAPVRDLKGNVHGIVDVLALLNILFAASRKKVNKGKTVILAVILARPYCYEHFSIFFVVAVIM